MRHKEKFYSSMSFCLVLQYDISFLVAIVPPFSSLPFHHLDSSFTDTHHKLFSLTFKQFASFELEVSSDFKRAGVELLGRVHSPAYIARVDALSKQRKKDGLDLEKDKDKDTTTGESF